jgi:hypothetical protein
MIQGHWKLAISPHREVLDPHDRKASACPHPPASAPNLGAEAESFKAPLTAWERDLGLRRERSAER